jgi:integrase
MASVVEKPNGFMMRWSVTCPTTRKLSKRSRMFKGTGGKRAAQAEANRLEAVERAAPTTATTKGTTFSAYINGQWLPRQRERTAPASYRTDEERIAPWVAAFGQKEMVDITSMQIDQTLPTLHPSVAMQVKYFDTLRKALRQAKKWKVIADAPWEDADRPTAPTSKAKAATMDESDKLAAAFREADKPIPAAFVDLAAETGMRPQEVLALHWDQVDLDAATVHVWRVQERVSDSKWVLRDTPKTEGSDRVINLSPQTVQMLKGLRAHHAKLHLASGGTWPKDGLLFPSTKGTLWMVGPAGQVIRRMANNLGVATGIYSRRHGSASSLLSASVPVPVVSQRLGHASTKMTLDTYAHVMPGDEYKAVDFFAARKNKTRI